VHPASRLADAGCSIVRVEAFHPEPARVRSLLDSIAFAGPLTVAPGSAPYLLATIDTPAGPKQIGGPAA
jgi:hypothetical protein